MTQNVTRLRLEKGALEAKTQMLEVKQHDSQAMLELNKQELMAATRSIQVHMCPL